MLLQDLYGVLMAAAPGRQPDELVPAVALAGVPQGAHGGLLCADLQEVVDQVGDGRLDPVSLVRERFE
ncbi:hypothetical protein ACIRO1_45445 [Streptomyces sp. NPDC102381]|uniref:hypothetical protein n=1 Tax=Streptomyces sp. NPDC102381 TaxID=3366164 RepID=UPI0038169052